MEELENWTIQIPNGWREDFAPNFSLMRAANESE